MLLSKGSTSNPPSPRTWKKGKGIAEYPCVLVCSSRNRAFDTTNASSGAAAFNLTRYNSACLPLSSVLTPGTHTPLMIVSPPPPVGFTRAATARACTGVLPVTRGGSGGVQARACTEVLHVTKGGSRGGSSACAYRGPARHQRGFTRGFTRAATVSLRRAPPACFYRGSRNISPHLEHFCPHVIGMVRGIPSTGVHACRHSEFEARHTRVLL